MNWKLAKYQAIPPLPTYPEELDKTDNLDEEIVRRTKDDEEEKRKVTIAPYTSRLANFVPIDWVKQWLSNNTNFISGILDDKTNKVSTYLLD